MVPEWHRGKKKALSHYCRDPGIIPSSSGFSLARCPITITLNLATFVAEVAMVSKLL